MIPETILFERGFPKVWFSWEKQGQLTELKKYLGKDITEENVIRSFCEDQPFEIVAEYITTVREKDAAGPLLKFEYLTADGLRQFMSARAMGASGVMQKFVVPQSSRNKVFHAVWTPSTVIVTSRLNIHPLRSASSLTERCVTFDGSQQLSTCGLVTDAVKSRVSSALDEFARLIKHTEGVELRGVVGLLKIDQKGNLYFNVCTSIRSQHEDVTGARRPLTLATEFAPSSFKDNLHSPLSRQSKRPSTADDQNRSLSGTVIAPAGDSSSSAGETGICTQRKTPSLPPSLASSLPVDTFYSDRLELYELLRDMAYKHSTFRQDSLPEDPSTGLANLVETVPATVAGFQQQRYKFMLPLSLSHRLGPERLTLLVQSLSLGRSYSFDRETGVRVDVLYFKSPYPATEEAIFSAVMGVFPTRSHDAGFHSGGDASKLGASQRIPTESIPLPASRKESGLVASGKRPSVELVPRRTPRRPQYAAESHPTIRPPDWRIQSAFPEPPPVSKSTHRMRPNGQHGLSNPFHMVKFRLRCSDAETTPESRTPKAKPLSTSLVYWTQ
jgi:hypothetical protein